MNNQSKPDGIVKVKCRIADVNVGMIVRRDGIIETQARNYIHDFEGDPQIVVGFTDEYLEVRRQHNPQLTLLEHEYMWTGEAFYLNLLDFDGFMLHASGVVYENKAYLFSAPSGTGKSTHTSIWQRVFGNDKTFIINDDKPAIKLDGDVVKACGTPWSGKYDQSRNADVPIKGICFLERAEVNSIEEMEKKEAIHQILNQTIRPRDPKDMEKLLTLLDRLLDRVKVYRLGCNMDDEAAYVAYRGMNDIK